MAHSLKVAAAVCLLAGTAQGGCPTGEVSFLICRIQASDKSLSVCFDDQNAFYRFGVEGQQPELELTEPVATLDYEPWPGVSSTIWESVRFNNAGYQYEVYGAVERIYPEDENDEITTRVKGGVHVTRGDQVVAELSCDPETLGFLWDEGLGAAKRNLGYSWNYQSHEWVALPD